MDNLKNKKILLFGAGSVGSYYAFKLTKAGFQTTLLARSKTYETLKERKLKLISFDKTEEEIKVNVINTLDENEKFDFIIICVKSMDTDKALESIKNNVSENTLIISFQNGIRNIEKIATMYGENKAFGASVHATVEILEPGVVKCLGFNTVLVGGLTNTYSNELNTFKDILSACGILCEITNDIKATLWNKLVWNAAFNSVSILSRKTVDEIIQDEKLLNLIRNIMIEVRETAIANGVNIKPDIVELHLSKSNERIQGVGDFVGFKTSMLQDFEKGKRLESDELIGVIIKKAKEKNILVPNLESVYSQVCKVSQETLTVMT